MKLSAAEFLDWPAKRVTLLGMSGVGKTRLANLLREDNWFHYSVDYRIGTRYLDEPILDNIKRQAMQVPFLRELLLTDSIYISNNITVDNLKPLSTFLGMLGDPDKGGLPLPEFRRRQHQHLLAELEAMRDVPAFIEKAGSIYGYRNFLNDASGSFCEIDDDEVLAAIAGQSLIIYLEASAEDEAHLIERAQLHPKPLYYREQFLDEHLQKYQAEHGIEYTTLIDPGHFVRWIFPYLFRSRVPRYRAIAEAHGYTVSAREAFQVRSAAEFLELVAGVLD